MESITCPDCGSTHVILSDTVDNIGYYWCTDCGMDYKIVDGVLEHIE